MKLLFIGDVVGSPGRKALAELLPGLRAQHGLDVVVANGENSAGGNGITPDTAAEIYAAGVDVITCGIISGIRKRLRSCWMRNLDLCAG